jgi:HEAT repeat protein
MQKGGIMGWFKPNVSKMTETGDIDGLIRALSNKNYLIREEAAEALGKSGDPRATDALLVALKDQRLGTKGFEALGRLRDARAVEPLCDLLRRSSWFGPPEAVTALGNIGDRRAVEILCAALSSEDFSVRCSAIDAVAKIPDERAAEPLCKLLEETSWAVREDVVKALGAIGGERVVEPLGRALLDKEPLVAIEAVKALENIQSPGAAEGLGRGLQAQDYRVRSMVAMKLGALGDTQSVGLLVAALADVDWPVQVAAAHALLQLGVVNAEGVNVLRTVACWRASGENATSVLLAAMTLVLMGDPQGMGSLKGMVDTGEAKTRAQAADMLRTYSRSGQWRELAAARLSQKLFVQAIQCAERGLELNPNDSELWNTKGVGLLALNRYEEAIASFDQGLQLDETDPVLLSHKQIALEAMGQRDKAKERAPHSAEPPGERPSTA